MLMAQTGLTIHQVRTHNDYISPFLPFLAGVCLPCVKWRPTHEMAFMRHHTISASCRIAPTQLRA